MHAKTPSEMIRSFTSFNVRRKVLWAALMTPAFLAAGYARATHKSWVRLDGGTSCIEQSANIASGLTVYKEATWNATDTTASVTCPIKMGGLFLDTAHNVPQHTKVPSMRIQVHYFDGSTATNQNTGCSIIGLTATGAVHQTPFRTGCSVAGGCLGAAEANFSGSGVLDFADPNNIPSRRIGIDSADSVSDIRSYGASCLLGPAGSAGASGLFGILTQTCQKDPATSFGPCFE
jgi:hypothetical protein